MSKENNMSPSLEDYLEMILELRQRNGLVRVTDLASALEVSKPSVNQAISALSERGLVFYERYKPIQLTPKGEEEAKAIFHNHLLLKAFFIKILKVSDEVAERDACKAEHILSQETLGKIQDYMQREKESNN